MLRWINVGGKNKLAMPQLKALFEELGFSDVSTYINSGYLIFSSESDDVPQLISLCQTAISEHFGLELPVMVLSLKKLQGLVDTTPEWWDVAHDTIHYVIFVIPPMQASQVMEVIGDIKPDYEKIARCEEIFFWSAP
ncbi:hypothetical protein NRIC_04340 [Enterococcus florum]|uniref:Uncharacterized protein n=1 Tax=Enterococcus florum TaxID=2480627 RepID=A0A4P5PGC4_9ENTE|nr:hypothetical protein NRIC_04340 [Enterococcus florum]